METETTAWVAAVVGDSGTVSAGRQTIVDNLIAGLKADGIFTKLDRIWLFAAENSQSALRDLVAAASASAVGTPIFTTDVGYAGMTSPDSYINSNFNPSTATTPKFTRNSACAFGWSNSSAALNEQPIVGQQGLGLFMYPMTSGNVNAAINEAVTFSVGITVANGLGFYHVNRSASNAEQIYKNGSSVQTGANASVLPENSNIFFLRASTPWTGQARLGGFGQSLTATEATNIWSRFTTYLAAVDSPGTTLAWAWAQGCNPPVVGTGMY